MRLFSDTIIKNNSATSLEMEPLINEVDAQDLSSTEGATVYIGKNSDKLKPRDCDKPIRHEISFGVTKLIVPLSEKDTDTEGKLIIYVGKKGSFPSVLLADVFNSF